MLDPYLTHYLTPGDPCTATGTSGSWSGLTGNSAGWQQVSFDVAACALRQVEVSISYVTDPSTGGGGVFVDEATLTVDGQVVETEGFETGPGVWSIPGVPPGSPPDTGNFRIGPPTTGR